MQALTITDTVEGVGQAGIAFTLMTSHAGSLNKSLSLEGGTLKATASAQLTNGTAQTMHRPSVEELQGVILSLKDYQAIMWGVCGQDTVHITTEKRRHVDSTSITRSKRYFSYPKDGCFVSLDFDQPKEGEPLTPEQGWGVLVSVVPALEGVKYLVVGSSKSGLMADEKLLSDRQNFRIIFAAQGITPDTLADVLLTRLIVAGHGRVEISKAGSKLLRTLFDRAAVGPERLDFLAAPTLGAGLTQDRLCAVVPGPRGCLDGAHVEPLRSDELAAYDAEVARLNAEAEPKARAVREARIEGEAARLIASGVEVEAARSTARRKFEQGVLEGGEVVTFSDRSTSTAADICANPGKYRGMACYDPADDTNDNDSDPRIAKVVWDGLGSWPAIRSYAHGGRTWHLKPYLSKVQIRPGDTPEAAAQSLAVLVHGKAVFHRGGRLCEVLRNGGIRLLDDRTLALLLETHTRFEKYNAAKQCFKSCHVEDRLVKAVLSLDAERHGVPELVAVSDLPMLRPDGSIADQPGYDASLKMLLRFDPDEWGERIPEKPTAANAVEACRRVLEPLSGFPFVSPADRAGLLTALLTAVLRDVVPTAPIFLVKATSPGTGKSLLAAIITVVRGGSCRVLPAFTRRGDEELEKVLGALLDEAVRTASFDNLTGTVRSDALCAFVTAETYSHRPLARTATNTAANRLMVLVNGNNIIPEGDMVRRTVQIGMDAGVEIAWQREFNGNVLAWHKANRAQVVCDLLTIVRAWQCAGSPREGVFVGSFEEWDALCRQPVLWLASLAPDLGLGDPVAAMQTQHEEDPDTLKLRAVLRGMGLIYPKGATVKRILADCDIQRQHRNVYDDDDEDDPTHAFFDAVESIAEIRGRMEPRLLGHWFRERTGRICGGMRLVKGRPRDGSLTWSVELVG